VVYLQRLERCNLVLLRIQVFYLWELCVLYIGQGLRYSPENAFYIFNQQIYLLSDICLTVHHWYK